MMVRRAPFGVDVITVREDGEPEILVDDGMGRDEARRRILAALPYLDADELILAVEQAGPWPDDIPLTPRTGN